MFENVVVGIRDVTTGPDAIALAGQLVSPSGELTLLHVQEVHEKPAPDSGGRRGASLRRCWMDQLAALAEQASIDASVACVTAHSPRRGLHEFASRSRPELLVVRATSRGEVDRDVIGDDARRVLQAAPCPVAIAPGGYRACAAAIRRIGVGYDGSVESQDRASSRTRASATTWTSWPDMQNRLTS